MRINGELTYLWRAVDADGTVLDILVRNRRDKAAARRFFRRLLETTPAAPRVIVTDKPRSHDAAHRHLMTTPDYRAEMTIRFAIWNQITRAAGQPAEA